MSGEPAPVVAGAAPPSRSSASAAWRGVRDMGPMLAGYLPFGLVIGVAVAAADPVPAGWFATLAILGGSAQLVTLQLLDAGSSILLVVVAGLVTNARLLAYSASLAPQWRGQSRWFRLVGAALLIDPTWALARADAGSSPRDHRRYYLGASLTLAVGWLAFVTLGMLAGDRLATHLSGAGVLALAAPLSLASIVVPQVTDRPAAAVVVTAATVGWLTADWPAGSGLLLALVAATVVGVVAGAGSGRSS